MNLEEQELLLKIVQTWSPSRPPEYRGFRCANCQRYINKAFYHWLDFGGYKLPVHLCRDCEDEFRNRNLKIDDIRKQPIDLQKFETNYSEKTEERFGEIVDLWEYREPELRRFFCDECGLDLNMEKLFDGSMRRQGYHVWWKMPNGQILTELHFHKDCASKLGIRSIDSN